MSIFRKKRYEGVRFNVISVTRGWVGVQFPEKKRYITLEWPLRIIVICITQYDGSLLSYSRSTVPRVNYKLH